jgi:hypothetical protein
MFYANPNKCNTNVNLGNCYRSYKHYLVSYYRQSSSSQNGNRTQSIQVVRHTRVKENADKKATTVQ